tara:strand:+ start:1363 stop:1488 length:126 start_codon:yes stop_codon:yes gene_type:complete
MDFGGTITVINPTTHQSKDDNSVNDFQMKILKIPLQKFKRH